MHHCVLISRQTLRGMARWWTYLLCFPPTLVLNIQTEPDFLEPPWSRQCSLFMYFASAWRWRLPFLSISSHPLDPRRLEISLERTVKHFPIGLPSSSPLLSCLVRPTDLVLFWNQICEPAETLKNSVSSMELPRCSESLSGWLSTSFSIFYFLLHIPYSAVWVFTTEQHNPYL